MHVWKQLILTLRRQKRGQPVLTARHSAEHR
jgi:hypothetical protein